MSENVKRHHIQGYEWEDFEAEDGSWVKSEDVDILIRELQDAQESAARAENMRKEAEEEFRRNGIDGNEIVDALIFGFNMVYTSPAWSGDERTPEGWKKKEKAIRKAFTATIKKMMTLFAVGADYFKERVRVSNDSLQIKMKEVELLRTALAAAEERARTAEEMNNKAVCIYCGNVCEKSDIAMADHVVNCERHPINALIEVAREINALRSISSTVQDESAVEWCDYCDGCGWTEGGETLKTECPKCGGTGRSTRPVNEKGEVKP